MTTAIAGRITPGQPTDLEQRRRQHRARVPRRDDCRRVAAADRPARGHERAVRLAAHGLRRLLVHLDDLRRLDELEPRRVDRRRAEEHRLNGVRARVERTRNDLVRRTVAAERVDGHADGTASLLGSRSSERLDLAPAVRLARRAHAVRLLGLAADRADGEARGLDLVLRTTLVAPRLRRLSLRDSHERLPSLARRRPLPRAPSRGPRASSAKSVTMTPRIAIPAATQNASE